MAVNKKLEIIYDLSSLNEQQANQLINANKDIIKSAEKQKKKSKRKGLGKQDQQIEKISEKLRKQVETDLLNKKGKGTLKSKLFGNQDFSKGGILKNLVKFGLNPQGMMGGLLKTGIPGFGAAVAATAIIVGILKKFDNIEKKFTDDIRTRLNQERDTEQTARIQAGLAQEIFTAGPGVTDPRDVYNTYDEFNTNQNRIETDYTIRNTSGVE